MFQQTIAVQAWTYNPAGCQPLGNSQTASRDIDGTLIDSFLNGHADAFGELVAPHLGTLTRFVRLRLRDDSEAEDVVQQAILQALHNVGQFRREASFKTWLSRITFNEVSHLRRGRAIAMASSLHQGYAKNLTDPACLPDMQCQRRQDILRLHRAVTQLPEKYRLVVEMRDLSELSVAATARALLLSPAAVKTRHHRARKLLLRSLATTR
jgi:RNA polymerase sigma-70 factor (ECF subfamily)